MINKEYNHDILMYENVFQIPSDYEIKLKKLSGYANEEIENYKDQNKHQKKKK